VAVANKKPVSNLSAKKLKEIWGKITKANWLTLLQEYKPQNNWTLSGKEIIGLCPYHSEQQPSFRVYLDRGYAICYGCNHYEWNPIKFFGDVSGLGYAGGLKELRKRFNLRLPQTHTQNAQFIEDNDALKMVLYEAMQLEFSELMENPEDPKYVYAQESGLIGWLRQRDFSEEAVHKWPVGVLPNRFRLSERLEEIGHKDKIEAAQKYLEDYLSIPGTPSQFEGSIVFFCFTSPNTIGRLKLRIPNTKKIYPIADPYSDEVGFFGLNTFSHLLGKLEKYPLLVVEGEMDVLSMFSHGAASGMYDVCMVSTGGNMDRRISTLLEYGFKEFWLIPDNDTGGIGWALDIMKHNDEVKRVYRWPTTDPQVRITDLDEAVRSFGFEKVYNDITTDSNYPRNYEWASEKLDFEIAKIDESDVEARNDKAIEFASSLREDASRSAFIDEVVQNHGLRRDVVIQNTDVADDTTEDFVRRLAKHLEKDYIGISHSIGRRGGAVSLWSRRKRILRHIVTSSEKQIRSVLETDLGLLEKYISEELGDPIFLRYKENTKGVPIPLTLTARSQMVNTIFSQSLSILSENTAPSECLEHLGQGLHYFENFDDERTIFIVNGSAFFKGKIKEDGTFYEQLDSPTCGKVFLQPHFTNWSDNLNSVEDIESGIEHDPKEIFKQIRDIVSSGWKFKDPELESQFLAADVMYTTVATAFDHMVMTDITGESHSGKTTLMQLLGGTEYPKYRICEPALYRDDFSAAAVRQMMKGISLRLFLDEFEDSDSGSMRTDRKANAVREFLNSIRQLSTGANSIRGTSGGEHQEYIMKFPLTIGGMYTMREHRDVNRFVHLKTLRVEGFQDPLYVVRSKYTEEEMAHLRRGVTLCWLPRLHELLKTYKEVQDEFASNEHLPAGVYTRLKKNLLPATAILKYIGEDYVSFISEFCKVKMEEFLEQGSVRESTQIWQNIFHTPVPLNYMESGRSGYSSIARIISDPSLNHLLNDSDMGAYYIKNKNWLVVFWQKITGGVLRYSNTYKYSQYPARLKTIADADPHVVPKEKINNSGFVDEYVVPLMGMHVKSDEISVIDLEDIIVMKDAIETSPKRDTAMDDVPAEIIKEGY